MLWLIATIKGDLKIFLIAVLCRQQLPPACGLSSWLAYVNDQRQTSITDSRCLRMQDSALTHNKNCGNLLVGPVNGRDDSESFTSLDFEGL